MRLKEIINEGKPVKPLTPEQARVARLQATAKRAKQAVKVERARQKLIKARQAVANAAKTLPAITQQVSHRVTGR